MDRPMDDLEPAVWLQILQTAHARRYIDSLTPWHAELCNVVISGSDSAWKALSDSGFCAEVARHVIDGYACGFSKRDLTSTIVEDEHTLWYISWLLKLASQCLNRMLTGPPVLTAGYRSMLAIYEKGLPTFFSNLWDVRNHLLLQPECCIGLSDDSEEGFPLHQSLQEFTRSADMAMETLRGISYTSRNSRVPHLMMFIWLHNEDRETRRGALEGMWATSTARDTCCDFHLEIVQDATLLRDNYAAILRDLRDEAVVDESLSSVLRHTLMLRQYVNHVDAVFDRRVVWTAMAAARRQLCLGEPPPDGDYSEGPCAVAIGLVADFVMTPEAEEPKFSVSYAQAYGIIIILSQSLINLIEGTATHCGIFDIVSCVLRCIQESLSKHRLLALPTNQKLSALQSYAHDSWQKSVAEVDRRGLVSKYPSWRTYVQQYKKLGTLISTTQQGWYDLGFSPLERCGWSGCVCSVVKPAHRLKVCKRCWLVAYCSAKCQKSDWDDHKALCVRNRTAR